MFFFIFQAVVQLTVRYIRGVPTCTQIRMCVQLDAASIGFLVTAKAVLSGHSKIDKNILMTNGSLTKVKSIAECSPWSILQYF